MQEDSVKMLADKVETAVTTLSSKLGVASEHFYPILVKQELIYGWLWLLGTLPLFLMALYLTYKSFALGADTNTGEKAFGFAFWAFVCYIVSTAALVMNISAIINPEYYALKEVISFVK